MPKCRNCQKDLFLTGPLGLCIDCEDAEKQTREKADLSAMILTTGSDIPGRSIIEIVDIIGSEVAVGMNIFKDIANNWRDFVGGRSGTVQKTLKEVRTICMAELKREAVSLGAQAVIGVKFDYSEVSTAGPGILFVAATGTAVRLN